MNLNVINELPALATHLERQDLLVDGEELRHGLGPGQQPRDVAAHLLGVVQVVVLGVEVHLQQVNHLVVDQVFLELNQSLQEAGGQQLEQ